MRFVCLLLFFLLIFTALGSAAEPLSLADRDRVNTLRVEAYKAALDLEQLKAALQRFQEIKARHEAVLAELRKLEEELSQTYSKGAEALNSDLVWVRREKPVEPPKKE